MKNALFPLALSLGLLIVPESRSETLCVSPDGGDDGSGSAEAPFTTLARARDAVRERIAAGLTEDISVILKPGAYRLKSPVVFGPEDSGTDRFSVTYRSEKEGAALLTGGVEISDWEETEDGLWKARLPKELRSGPAFRQLFHLCYRLPRARHPNEGFLRVEKVAADRRSGFVHAEGDLPSIPDLPGTELVFLHDWSITRTPIGSIDPATRTLSLRHPISSDMRWQAMDWFEKHPRYFLEHSRAFLDQPKEWVVDEKEGVLYFKPWEKASSNRQREKFRPVAPVTDQLLVVRGTREHPVRNLHFIGLRLSITSWRPPNGVYWGRQACTFFTAGEKEPREADPAAFHLQWAEKCRISGVSMRQLGGSGLWLERGCRDCVVEDSSVFLAGGNGIMIGEGKFRLLPDGRTWWEGAPEEAAGGNTVRRCTVSRCGQELFGAVGIWIGLASGTTIAENTISHLPYTGISAGWMWWRPEEREQPRPTPARENVIERNHISHVMAVLSDGGGIYTLGDQPGSIIRGNRIHDIPENAGRAESNGMFLDQGTGSFVIEDNLIYGVDRSPFRFNKGWKNVIRNNRVLLPEGIPLVKFGATDPERIEVTGNIILPDEEALKQAIENLKEKGTP